MGSRRVSASRLLRRQDGAVIVEYSIVLPLVMMFFLAMLDLSLLYISDSALLQGVEEAARQLRTGQLKAESDAEAFKTAVCDGAGSRIDCSTTGKQNMVLVVRNFTDWSSVNWDPIYDEATGALVTFTFKPAGASNVKSGTFTITSIEVGLNYDFITPGVQYFLGRSTSIIPLVHTSIVVVEPYE